MAEIRRNVKNIQQSVDVPRVLAGSVSQGIFHHTNGIGKFPGCGVVKFRVTILESEKDGFRNQFDCKCYHKGFNDTK